jgi:cytochrome c oxidase cbb3-type subunit IV
MDLTSLYEVARSLWVVWLMILFAGVVFWAFRPKNKKRFEDDARIPFREENGG